MGTPRVQMFCTCTLLHWYILLFNKPRLSLFILTREILLQPMETDNRNIPFSGQWVYLTQHHGYQLVREPRVTMKFTMDQLKEIENVPLELDFPNHTQSVERAVALTSASVKRLTG